MRQPTTHGEEVIGRPCARKSSSAGRPQGGSHRPAKRGEGHFSMVATHKEIRRSSTSARLERAEEVGRRRGKEMVVEDEAEAAQANPSTSAAATVGEEGRRDPRAPSRRRLRRRRSALCT
uniref:Uncharacterized protein n=1 Tax=Oryza glumipatula TaxID=40148 RepID=A0A0E0ALI7_9ORYZ